MSKSWFICLQKWSSLVNSFFIMLTLMVDTVFGSALSPLSVNMVLFTVTGAISTVIVNDYTNGSVYTNGCYRAFSW